MGMFSKEFMPCDTVAMDEKFLIMAFTFLAAGGVT